MSRPTAIELRLLAEQGRLANALDVMLTEARRLAVEGARELRLTDLPSYETLSDAERAQVHRDLVSLGFKVEKDTKLARHSWYMRW
jgi:hypothetical protein